MSLKIKEVSMRNFLSIGNAQQTVKLDSEGLTLVLGENMDTGGTASRNGVGKTALMQAISFALFGVPLSNIKRDNLVNSINTKNMVVNISFEKDGKKYRIERGRKPQFIRYYVNDGLVNDNTVDEAQGDTKNTQVEIERVLGFSHDMFKHIVAMNTYTEPFLKMRPADQKALIEELLGITQISTRSDILKEMIKSSKDTIKEEEFRLKTMIESNQTIQSSIDDLVKLSDDWESAKDKRVTTTVQQIEGLKELDIDEEIEAHRLLSDFRTLSNELTRTNKEYRRLDGEVQSKSKTYERYLSQLKMAESHKCHACGQELHDETHEKQIEDIKKNIERLEEEIVQLAADVEVTITMKNELQDSLVLIGDEPMTVYSSLEQAYEHRNTIEKLAESLVREDASTNPYTEQIETLKAKGLQDINYDTLTELQSLLKHQDFLLKLLVNKDSFIRKKIINQNINHLNHRLNFYLDKLGLPHEVEFKSDLSVEINLLGRDFDFEQLSRGEMNRVILSTSWAFRDVWESLNHSINLVFLDEILDNGLDQQGSETALTVLKAMARDRGRNVFLVSHKEELIGRVEKILHVKKENSFTKFLTNDEE